jgi:tripartite-type tricarboxylate transporter receptor subunit TctC
MSSRMKAVYLRVAVGLLLMPPSLAAFGQAAKFPQRHVVVIVPFAAGGPTDILARVMAEAMAKDLGQPVVIENAPGAGGTVGNARVAVAPADGYTLLVGNVGTLAASATLYKKLSYNVLTDFIPLGSMGDAPQVISANKNFPPTGLTQFAEYTRVHASTLNVGAAGIGSGSYLGALLVGEKLGVKVNIVNYRGAAQALNDVIAGHIDYLVDSTTTSASYIRAGSVKGVAVLRPGRVKVLPDVPAAGESRLPDLHYDIWNMMLAPKGTPAPVVARLNEALRKAIRSPEVQSRLEASGVETPPAVQQTAEGAAELLATQVAAWRSLIGKFGVTAE